MVCNVREGESLTWGRQSETLPLGPGAEAQQPLTHSPIPQPEGREGTVEVHALTASTTNCGLVVSVNMSEVC